jgi:hypothetical protein
VGVSGVSSLALRLRGALGGLAWGIEAEDAVETKAREARSRTGWHGKEKVGGKEG